MMKLVELLVGDSHFDTATTSTTSTTTTTITTTTTTTAAKNKNLTRAAGVRVI
jgi:hypothetical protein